MSTYSSKVARTQESEYRTKCVNIIMLEVRYFSFCIQNSVFIIVKEVKRGIDKNLHYLQKEETFCILLTFEFTKAGFVFN